MSVAGVLSLAFFAAAVVSATMVGYYSRRLRQWAEIRRKLDVGESYTAREAAMMVRARARQVR